MKIVLAAVLSAILFYGPASADHIQWLPDAPHITGFGEKSNYYDPNTGDETTSYNSTGDIYQQYAFEAFNTNPGDSTFDFSMYFSYSYDYNILIENMAGLNDFDYEVFRFEASIKNSGGTVVESIGGDIFLDLQTSSSGSYSDTLTLSLPDTDSYFLDVHFYTDMLIDSVTSGEGISDMPDPNSPMGYSNYLSTILSVTADTIAPPPPPPSAPVPEPTTILLIGVGLAGLYSRRRYSKIK